MTRVSQTTHGLVRDAPISNKSPECSGDIRKSHELIEMIFAQLSHICNLLTTTKKHSRDYLPLVVIADTVCIFQGELHLSKAKAVKYKLQE